MELLWKFSMLVLDMIYVDWNVKKIIIIKNLQVFLRCLSHGLDLLGFGAWQKLPPPFLTFLALFSFSFSIFFFWLFLCNVDFLFLLFFFFLSLVLSGGGFFFFFLNFYFYYFFKKTFLDDFLCYFLKCPLSSVHNFFLKYNILLFVLFKRDMMVNLYKLYFQPNQKVFHPSTFPPSQPNTNQ